MNKKSCNKKCNGIIKEIVIKGINFPTIICVEYRVDDKIYELGENFTMKKEKNIVVKFIPICYKTKSLIEIKTGIKAITVNKVNIKYEESNPNNVYLTDNVGKVTWN